MLKGQNIIVCLGRVEGGPGAQSRPQGHTREQQHPLHLVGALGFALAALGSQPDPHLGAELLALSRTQLQETGWEEEREKHLVKENPSERMWSSPAGIQLYTPNILRVPESGAASPPLPNICTSPFEGAFRGGSAAGAPSAVPNRTAQGPGPLSCPHTPS